jgi:hypothetical protein
MKYREIRRLEFSSDKIEGGDSKMKVMCICFDHPTKKTELDWGLPWWVAIAGLESLIVGHGREWRGRRSREGEGDCWLAWSRKGAHGGAAPGGLGPAPAVRELLCAFSVLLHEIEEKEEREKRKKKKEKEKKKRRKNWEIFWNLKIFTKKNKSQFIELV